MAENTRENKMGTMPIGKLLANMVIENYRIERIA